MNGKIVTRSLTSFFCLISVTLPLLELFRFRNLNPPGAGEAARDEPGEVTSEADVEAAESAAEDGEGGSDAALCKMFGFGCLCVTS